MRGFEQRTPSVPETFASCFLRRLRSIQFGLLAVATIVGLRAQSNVRFVDVTSESGITFSHTSTPEKKYIVESMSGGVLVLDYDDDGWPDLYFVNSLTVDTAARPRSAESHLYRNKGNWTFEEVGQKAGVAYPGWGMGGCAGDFNGDGRLDMYVTCLGENRLYQSNSDGTFSEVSQALGVADPRYSAGCGFADYDNDGDLDLFVSNYVDFKMDDLPEFGKGALCQYKGIPVQCGPRGLPGAGDALFRQEADGRFTDVSKIAGTDDPDGYYGMGVIWTDVDEDGFVDLFVANDSRPNFLYRNRGNGTFEEVGFLSGTAVGDDGSEQGSMGVAAGDYDRDGRIDLFVTNFSDEYNTIYRLEGNFFYTDLSVSSRTTESSFPYVGWGTGFIDADNDGWLDLFVVNGHVYPQVDGAGLAAGYMQKKLFYRNDGKGTFVQTGGDWSDAFAVDRVGRGSALADLDNDGDEDIVIADLDGPPMILRNDGGNAKNWLRLKLVGKGRNRTALGARIRLVSGDLTQVDEVRSGNSYLSQDDFRLHFGLGTATQADLIEVKWPGGGTTILKDVDANREILIRQEDLVRSGHQR